MAERMVSLACVRVRVGEGFVGCGRGWEAPAVPNPRCMRCGREARVTGTYTTYDLSPR